MCIRDRISPAGLTPQIQLLLGTLVLALNLGIYSYVAWRWRRPSG
mgnify:FL=1